MDFRRLADPAELVLVDQFGLKHAARHGSRTPAGFADRVDQLEIGLGQRVANDGDRFLARHPQAIDAFGADPGLRQGGIKLWAAAMDHDR